jgi:hypothetical protein
MRAVLENHEHEIDCCAGDLQRRHTSRRWARTRRTCWAGSCKFGRRRRRRHPLRRGTGRAPRLCCSTSTPCPKLKQTGCFRSHPVTAHTRAGGARAPRRAGCTPRSTYGNNSRTFGTSGPLRPKPRWHFRFQRCASLAVPHGAPKERLPMYPELASGGYLFSLAVRTNPFDPNASAEVT